LALPRGVHRVDLGIDDDDDELGILVVREKRRE